MKKIIISIPVLIAWAVSLSAQVTREQADAIVQDYVQREVTQPGRLYFNINEPSAAGMAVTTSNGEKVKAKYPCWAYYLDENEPFQRRYLFVKENNGSLLEVIAGNDLGTGELADSWMAMAMPTCLIEKEGNVKLLYPNPVGDLLTLPCNSDQTRIEIYDLKGTRLFSGVLPGKDSCRLNVSFLNTGIYMVNVSGETYKIIKN